jgi:hypothetical protein
MRASQSLGRGSFNVGGVSMLEGSDFCRVFAQNNVTGVRVQLLKAHRCHVRPLWYCFPSFTLKNSNSAHLCAPECYLFSSYRCPRMLSLFKPLCPVRVHHCRVISQA